MLSTVLDGAHGFHAFLRARWLNVGVCPGVAPTRAKRLSITTRTLRHRISRPGRRNVAVNARVPKRQIPLPRERAVLEHEPGCLARAGGAGVCQEAFGPHPVP